MERTGGDDVGPGGKASLTALAGTVTFVVGVVLAALIGPVGVFFAALGGFVVLASPVVWVLLRWDARSAGEA